MSKKYHKLGGDEFPGDSKGLDLSESVLPTAQAVDSLTGTFSVKILLKETNIQLPGLTDLTTVGELKIEIEKLTNIAVKSQRLIFAGKQLKADEKTMKSFSIVGNSSIHLFPIPPKPTEIVGDAPTATPIATPSTMNSLSNLILPSYPAGVNNDLSIHLDPEISQHCREVNLVAYSRSCLLLFVTCSIICSTQILLIASLNFITKRTGKFGINPLDSAVRITDTLCSIGGLFVGQYGLNAAHTIDMTMIKKYLRRLTILASICILMRIVWIFDIVIQVKQALNKAKNDPTYVPTDADGTASSKDFPMTNFTVQVTIIGLVCVAAWLNCLYRAYLLRRSVQTFSDATAV